MMDAADLYPEILRPYDARRNPLPPPTQGVCDAPYYTICMNEFWWAHVSGQIARLLYRDAWEGTDDEIDDAIDSISKILNVGRPTMSCGCGCGANGLPSRYTADGVFQVSYDGGITWVDAPQLDPRTNATLLPPLSGPDGDDKKCQAAANMKRHIHDQTDDTIAQLEAGGSLTELVAVLVEILIFIGVIGSLGALTPLFLALGGILVAAGSGAFSAAMTSTVYETLQCIFFCNMSADASFTDAQFSQIISDINDQIGGIAQTYLVKTVQALGKNGLTNMARTASGEAADCSSCDDCSDCVTFAFPAGPQPSYDHFTFDPDDCTYKFYSTDDPSHAGQKWVGLDFGTGVCFTVEVTDLSAPADGLSFGWLDCGAGSETQGGYTQRSVNYLYNNRSSGDFTMTIKLSPP